MIPLALARNWKPVAVLVALAALALWGAIGWSGKRHAELVAKHCQQARDLDRKTYEEAQARATAIAQEAARNREAREANITQERAREIAKVTADLDARYRERLRTAPRAAEGAAGSIDLRPPSSTSGTTDAPAGSALVALRDLERCNAAYVTATEWQAWWSQIEKQGE